MAVPVVYAMPDLANERLTAWLPAHGYADLPVLQAANLHLLPKNVPLAVVVVPAGIEVNEQRRGQVAIAEAFVVVAQCRNPTSQRTAEAVLEEVGPLLVTCVAALLGWTPDADAYEPLTMIAAPAPEYEAGFGFYPIAFQTRYVLSGATT